MRKVRHDRDATHGSQLPFHEALRNSDLDDWMWVVLEVLENPTRRQLFRCETNYQHALNSVGPTGFNTKYASVDQTATLDSMSRAPQGPTTLLQYAETMVFLLAKATQGLLYETRAL